MPPQINRRQALAGLGTVSLAGLLAACSDDEGSGQATTVEPSSGQSLAELFDDSSACTLTPELTEGPYYFDVDSVRSDISEDRDGVTLRLAVRVRDARSCQPLRNAVVDIWHCDAVGVYSGFESGEGETFLRGTQVTDRDGIVEFTTVYPGAYQGRTVHIHAKVHLDGSTALTTQLFFDDGVSDKVYAREPYSGSNTRDTTNESDGIFDESLVLDLSSEGDGYLGLISFDANQA
jgi:protocatechuate 3,4-dioxygenase beta subunit